MLAVRVRDQNQVNFSRRFQRPEVRKGLGIVDQPWLDHDHLAARCRDARGGLTQPEHLGLVGALGKSSDTTVRSRVPKTEGVGMSVF